MRSHARPFDSANSHRTKIAPVQIGQGSENILDDTQQKGELPGDQPVAAPSIEPAPVGCRLKLGDLDECGNTVKYIYASDQDYVVYYSRLEQPGDTQSALRSACRSALRRLFAFAQRHPPELPYESEGVQAQLSCDPAKRKALRQQLLPLGTERAKLQALLRGWPRRQSYDSSIATALQLALSGEGKPEANQNALQALHDAKDSILTEREIAGRAQYVRYTLMLGMAALFLLFVAQQNIFQVSPNFWLGTQSGVIGAILSIAIGIRRRVVLPDIGRAGNMSDSALRLLIGAVSGGTLVLLFSCGLIPPLHTLGGDLDANSSIFAPLLGIIAGFVEQLVPSLLDEQAARIQNGGSTQPQTATAPKPPPAPAPSGSGVTPTAPAVTG